MTEVVVTGIGLVSALAPTLGSSWKRLLMGQSGIQTQRPFPELPPHPLGLVAAQPSDLKALLLAAVTAAIEDARLTPARADCGVVVGSSRGAQAQLERLVRERILPTGLQSEQLPLGDLFPLYGQSPATLVAQQIGSTGPVLSPRAACATGVWAIAQGAELIRTGHCQRVIAGAVEAPITPLTLAGFAKMGALASSGAYPFDYQREGFVLGEGAALLVLEAGALAERRGAKIYGQILGFGCTADGYHRSAPDRDRHWAMAAVQHCLQRSHLCPEEVGYIHAHGTATRLNDQAEATLIRELFPQSVPVSSTKGATGHSLGASGALGTAFCLMALQQQVLPPCVGLRHSNLGLNVVQAAMPTQLSIALCFSFGFGGQNAILALAHWDGSRGMDSRSDDRCC